MHLAERVMCTLDQVELFAITLGDGGEIFVDQLLTCANIGIFCTRLLEFLQLCFGILLTLLQVAFAILDELFLVFKQHFFKFGHVGMTLVGIDTAHQPGGKVNNLFKLLRLDFVAWLKTTQQIGQP